MLNYRVEILVACLALFSGCYFYNGAQWNQNARFDSVFAAVEAKEDGVPLFAIDRFILDGEKGINTGDWARYDDHYFSNKAPGPALIGAAVYWPVYQLQRLIGIDSAEPKVALLNAYWIHILATVLPMAIALLFAMPMFTELCDGDRKRGLLFTVTLYWGTLLWPFCTQYWGHPTAAAGVIVAFACAMRSGPRWAIGCGLSAGFAVLSEYSCGIVVVVLGALYLWRRQPCEIRNYVLGGLAPLLVFAWYHWICFGSPLTIANAYNNPVFMDADRVGGLFGGFSMEAFTGITFRKKRGLFAYMPVLLLVFPALYFLPKRRSLPIALASIACILGFLLMNCTFNGWHGGASFGPRYQIPVLICYVMLLTWLPDKPLVTVLHLLLLAISATHMLLGAMISPFAPLEVERPLPAYYRGAQLIFATDQPILHPFDGPIRGQAFVEPRVIEREDFNLGEALGLTGALSLLPFILVLGGGAFFARLWLPDDDDLGEEVASL
ncbi:MAG: hypothetical protein ACI8W8_001211 [Rhodothermales bacterium]|jgi:hypothetical protein